MSATEEEQHATRAHRAPSTLSRLATFFRPYRSTFAVGMAATLLSSGLSLVFPPLLGHLVDAAFVQSGRANAASFNRSILVIVLIFACSALFKTVQTLLLGRVGLGMVSDLRRALFGHLLTLSPRFFGDYKLGDLTSRLTADVASLQLVSSSALAQAATHAVTLLGAASLLFLTNAPLSLLTMIMVPVLAGTVAVFRHRIRRVSRTVQDEVAKANATATEAIGGVRIVQSFTAEPWERERYGVAVQASVQAAMRRIVLQAGLGGLMSFLSLGGLSVVLWYGGQQVLRGEITPGVLVTFLFYALQVSQALTNLMGVFNQFQEALGASGRIFELLDERSDITQPATPVALSMPAGHVEFCDVSFRYGQKEVLTDVSFQVPAGQVVALVGPSGAGKSTLVNLIPRFWDVTEGNVRVDGHDVRRFALADLRAQIAMVPQETVLFSGTIEENIRYGRPSATRAEVHRAARAANATEFIARLEHGFDTLVGERGVKLSGGQRQRIAIARALLKDPRILILDEATSALDNESEALVQAALERLMVGRTTFVVAHRLSTVRRADRILVIDGGRLAQEGTHRELLDAGGLYRDLHELQFHSPREGD